MERNATALVVEDDRAVQRMLAEALTDEGFSVLVEKDGDWALKTFEKKKVDVVLLDLMLPGQHGFEIARRMRILPKGRKVPIVFLSGVYKSTAHLEDAKTKYGVSAFLDKPVNLVALKNALREALGDKYPGAAAAAERRAQVDARPAEDFADESAKQEVAAVEHQTARRSAALAIKGDLKSRSFPELLAELYRWRATGALLLRREKVKKIVYFRDGRPFSVKSNVLGECLGRLMVRERMISESACEESLRRMKAAGRQQGTVLIEMGCISPHNLSYALALQLQTKLYDVFSWTEGDYQFSTAAEIPSDPNTLEVTTAQVIYEGIKRGYDEARVRAELGEVEQRYAHPAADPLLRFQEVGLDQEETALLTAMDGHKTVSTLVALNLLPPPATLKFLLAMRCAQMIELKAEPAEGPVESLFPRTPVPEPGPGEITEEVVIPAGLPGSALPPPLPPGALAESALPKPPLPPPPPPVDAWDPLPDRPSASLMPELSGIFSPSLSQEEREVRERLAAVAAAMRKKDHFQVLGVPPNAGKEEVRRAYFGLAKEYHPDKHFGSYSAEVRNLAAQIFDMVSTAHDVLVDDDERERYVGELASGQRKDVADEVSRIVAAEGKFQRGEDLLRRRLYREAFGAFREAVDLYADEGEFHAYLGWSLFQATPEDKAAAEKAIEHIEAGIRLNPKIDKGYLFLGYVHKAIGRPDRAEKQFEKAIQCNPDCIEALRELRLLGKGKRK